MPVSAPSYFPPPRAGGSIVGITAGVGSTADRVFLAGQAAGNGAIADDIIVIGDHAGVAFATEATPAGAVVIGSQALESATHTVATTGADVVIGFNSATATLRTGGNTLVGTDTLTTAAGGANDGEATIRNTLIGFEVVKHCADLVQRNTIIGARALSCANEASNLLRNVVIGDAVAESYARSSGIRDSVMVGATIAANFGVPGVEVVSSQNVFIGANIGNTGTAARSATDSILIGYGIDCGLTPDNCIAIGTNAKTVTGCVVIGNSSSVGDGSTDSVILGQSASIGTTTGNNTIIGNNITVANNVTDVILIGNDTGNLIPADPDLASFWLQIGSQTGVATIWADLDGNNVVLGRTQTSDDDLVAMLAGGDGPISIVMLKNGTPGGLVNPANGGYFYVNAGALHWIGSAGTDTTIAPA